MKTTIKKTLILSIISFMFLLNSACTEIINVILDNGEKISVIHNWYDDDNLLYEETGTDNSQIKRDLPQDTDLWDYISWNIETEYYENKTVINYYLVKELKKEYFVGNVFQIITYDLTKTPISTGSGFVVNDSGLFVTNAHVVDGAFYISAFFDIEDMRNNDSFTELEIKYLKYFDISKDIAIGKIENYSNIKSYYKDIDFTENHEIGETTYSIGYPNSSTDLEIHKGVVVEDITSLYSKIIQGITYIGSTSFIAPGSSGGILINNNGEVLGITSVEMSENNSFSIGGSISYSNFKNQITTASNFKNLYNWFYPSQVNFIEYFDSLYDKSQSNLEKLEYESFTRFVFTFYSEGNNSNNLDYSIEETLIIDSDGYISFSSLTYWEDGMKREYELYGYYNTDNDPLKYFDFDFYYQWQTNQWYRLYSNSINYSANLSLTLMEYTTSKGSLLSSISSSNIEYAKELFNSYYEYLYELFN